MEDQRTMDGATMAVYGILLTAAVVSLVIGVMYDSASDVLVSLPVIVVILITMANDKKMIHIPPALVVMVVAIMYVSLASRIVGGGEVLRAVQDILIGAVIGLAGLIIVYALLRELPGFDRERPALVSLLVFTFALAIYSLWKMFEFYAGEFTSYDGGMTIEGTMGSMFLASMGALFISVSFLLGRSSRFFNETIVRFLKGNSGAIGIQPALTDREQIMRIVSGGETEHVEFKSTLRTNLVTGERDKRMEKAVLKTVVAFLNTEGGTLLIGVSDDGRISGIDIESFESRDRMNLHMTNLISSQIGNEFLPYIDFRIIGIENVLVMRVDVKEADKPVFLKENRVETYYVRSGPSSVELTGMDLINYVENRKADRKGN